MLDKTNGEDLPGLGRGKLVPLDKWADVFDMLNVASKAAADEFRKAGAKGKIAFTRDQIAVQEYHLANKVMWLFTMKINGADHFYWYGFTLHEKILPELVASGLWPTGLIGIPQTLQ